VKTGRFVSVWGAVLLGMLVLRSPSSGEEPGHQLEVALVFMSHPTAPDLVPELVVYADGIVGKSYVVRIHPVFPREELWTK
jgi:hypothetical protein